MNPAVKISRHLSNVPRWTGPVIVALPCLLNILFPDALWADATWIFILAASRLWLYHHGLKRALAGYAGCLAVALGVEGLVHRPSQLSPDAAVGVLIMAAWGVLLLLMNSRLLEELRSATRRWKDEAVRDPLTGVFNRRAAEFFLAQEKERCDRHGHSFCAIAIDVDELKGLNDRCGHAAGDRYLQALTSSIRGGLRPSDILCRMSGDEFLAILPETDLARGIAVAERLKRAIADPPWVRRDAVPAMSASFGVCAYPDPASGIQELLQRADEALYAAKEGGRNAVRGYSGAG